MEAWGLVEFWKKNVVDEGRPPDLNDQENFPALTNNLDTSSSLQRKIQEIQREHQHTVKGLRYIIDNVACYISEAGADMGDVKSTGTTLDDLAAMLRGVTTTVDNNGKNISNLTTEVKSIGERVTAIEKGEKPKEKPKEKASTEEEDDAAIEMEEVDQGEGETSAKEGITPAKKAPILPGLSPKSEDSWAKRTALGGAVGTPKFDALLKTIPEEDPIRETLPFMEAKVKRPMKKPPTAKQMDDFDVSRCQIVSAVKDLHDMLETESRGKGAVRGARAGHKAKMTNVRKIMSALNVPDPRDGRRKSMVDGEKIPDGRWNFWFNLDSLERLNEDLKKRMEAFRQNCNSAKRMEEQALIEKSRQKVQVGPFYPKEWEKLDKEFGLEKRNKGMEKMVRAHLTRWTGLTKEEAESLKIAEIHPVDHNVTAMYPSKLVLVLEDRHMAWNILEVFHESPQRKMPANTCQAYVPDEFYEKFLALSKCSRKVRETLKWERPDLKEVATFVAYGNVDMELAYQCNKEGWRSWRYENQVRIPLTQDMNLVSKPFSSLHGHQARLYLKQRANDVKAQKTIETARAPLGERRKAFMERQKDSRDAKTASRAAMSTGQKRGPTSPLNRHAVPPGMEASLEESTGMGVETDSTDDGNVMDLLREDDSFLSMEDDSSSNNSYVSINNISNGQTSILEEALEDAAVAENTDLQYHLKEKLCEKENDCELRIIDNDNLCKCSPMFKDIKCVHCESSLSGTREPESDNGKLDLDTATAENLLVDGSVNSVVVKGVDPVVVDDDNSVKVGHSDIVEKPVRVAIGPRDNLKSRHSEIRVKIEFGQERSGTSRLGISGNKETLDMLHSRLISFGKNNWYRTEGYFLRCKNYSDSNSVIELGLRLQKDPTKGHDQILQYKRLSQTEINITGKKVQGHNRHLFGAICEILIIKPLERLGQRFAHLEIRSNNGEKSCGNCLDPKETQGRCRVCVRPLHEKCEEKQTCNKGCKAVTFEVSKTRLADLNIVNGRSVFYDDVSYLMTNEQQFVSYSTISEKALQELEALVKKQPLKKPKQVKVIMYNEVKSLKELSEDSCLMYKSEYEMFKDERLSPFEGFKLSPRKRKGKPEPEPFLKAGEILSGKKINRVEDHTPVDWVITRLVEGSGLVYLRPTLLNGDCFFSAIIEISKFYGDLEIPSDTVALRKWLMRRIMKLPETTDWVRDYFGGDRARFIAHMVSHFKPGMETDDFGLVCKGTAIVIKRKLRIIKEYHATGNGGFHEINATEETSRKPIYWLGLEHGHYRALAKPGQKNSETEKRKRNGTKLKKPEKDEERRRKEKEKSPEETDVEALQKTLEAMQRKCAIAENELALSLRREKTQSAFILSLEKRIANACEECREADPELSITSRDNYNLAEIKELLLRQEKTIEALVQGRTGPGEEKPREPTETL